MLLCLGPYNQLLKFSNLCVLYNHVPCNFSSFPIPTFFVNSCSLFWTVASTNLRWLFKKEKDPLFCYSVFFQLIGVIHNICKLFTFPWYCELFFSQLLLVYFQLVLPFSYWSPLNVVSLLQDTHSINKAALHQTELPNSSQNFSFICKKERSEDYPSQCVADAEPISLAQNKRSKPDNPNSSRGNGSEDSITTTHDFHISTTNATITTTNMSIGLFEFPLLESLEPKENNPNKTLTFDAANLEKSVPPGYLKFISNLENEILNVSMERETLKIEVMRAQAMINILQSRIELLSKENEDLKRVIRGV